MIVLPDAEDRAIVCSFTWTKHRKVTDERTDGQTDGRTDKIGLAITVVCIAHLRAMRTRCKNYSAWSKCRPLQVPRPPLRLNHLAPPFAPPLVFRQFCAHVRSSQSIREYRVSLWLFVNQRRIEIVLLTYLLIFFLVFIWLQILSKLGLCTVLRIQADEQPPCAQYLHPNLSVVYLPLDLENSRDLWLRDTGIEHSPGHFFSRTSSWIRIDLLKREKSLTPSLLLTITITVTFSLIKLMPRTSFLHVVVTREKCPRGTFKGGCSDTRYPFPLSLPRVWPQRHCAQCKWCMSLWSGGIIRHENKSFV